MFSPDGDMALADWRGIPHSNSKRLEQNSVRSRRLVYFVQRNQLIVGRQSGRALIFWFVLYQDKMNNATTSPPNYRLRSYDPERG